MNQGKLPAISFHPAGAQPTSANYPATVLTISTVAETEWWWKLCFMWYKAAVIDCPVLLRRAKHNKERLKIDMDSLGRIAPDVIIMKQIYNTQASGEKKEKKM